MVLTESTIKISCPIGQTNWYSSFDNMQVLMFFCALSLKMPIHASFCSFIPLGKQWPWIDVLWIKQRQNRFSGCRLVSGREQNLGSQTAKIKTTREWHFTCLPGRSSWGHRFEFWCAWWYRRRNHPSQSLWHSVEGFPSSNTPHFAILLRLN